MPTQTAQQIIATARRNAAALPSEQAAARERRNTARKAARKAREAAKPVRAARELPPIDGAHWVKRRYGSNWLYPAVQLTSPPRRTHRRPMGTTHYPLHRNPLHVGPVRVEQQAWT